MTNYERILKMKPLEMTNFLQNESMCSHCNHSKNAKDEFDDEVYECILEEGMDCINGCYEWLNSEIDFKIEYQCEWD